MTNSAYVADPGPSIVELTNLGNVRILGTKLLFKAERTMQISKQAVVWHAQDTLTKGEGHNSRLSGGTAAESAQCSRPRSSNQLLRSTLLNIGCFNEVCSIHMVGLTLFLFLESLAPFSISLSL